MPLRSAWFASFLLGMVCIAPGQGFVIFANTPSTAIYTNSPILSGTRGKTSGAAGGFYYALLTAPAGTTNNDLTSGLWNFTGVYATNTSLPGRLNGGTVAIPGWPAGTSNAFMIAGWSSNLGHDWATVYAELSNYYVTQGSFGLSAIGSGVAGYSPGDAFPLFGSGPFQQGVPVSGFDLYGALWGFVALALPASQTVAIGQAATFTLSLYSFGPINYQWHVPYGSSGAITNGGTLTIPSAKLSDAGTYTVFATADNGPFLIESANLYVIGPPTISVGIYSNGMYPGITIHGAPGWTYAIQSTTNLSNHSWSTITNLTVTQPVTLWQDGSVNLTTGAGVPPQQYYRVGLVVP